MPCCAAESIRPDQNRTNGTAKTCARVEQRDCSKQAADCFEACLSIGRAFARISYIGELTRRQKALLPYAGRFLGRSFLARLPAQDYHAADDEGCTEDSLPVHFLPEKYGSEQEHKDDAELVNRSHLRGVSELEGAKVAQP